jgi:hypothetical protein
MDSVLHLRDHFRRELPDPVRIARMNRDAVRDQLMPA